MGEVQLVSRSSALLVILLAQLTLRAQPATQPDPATRATSSRLMPMPGEQRLNAQIELLRGESLNVSLRNLSEAEMFYWPGLVGRTYIVIFPMRESEGAVDVERIYANRRFLKIRHELESLDPADAGQRVRAEIASALPLYKEMLSTRTESLVTNIAAAPAGRRSAGLSLQVGNNADGSPTLAGLRLKILSLALIAGDMHLKVARDQVVEISSEAMRQRARFYGDVPGLTESDRFSILTGASLYNRQILATALLGTKIEAAPADNSQAIPWKELTLALYDDVHPGRARLLPLGGPPVPSDDTKGKMVVRYVAPLGDEQFDSVWNGK